MQRVAILNSRQALRPTGADNWIQATLRAVEKLNAEENFVFLASLGAMTYELTLSHLSAAGATVEIILTADQLRKYADNKESLKRYLTAEFRLPARRMRIVSVTSDDLTANRRNLSHIRDRELLRRADIIVPISIRPGGFWDKRLADAQELSAQVDKRFAVTYQNSHTQIKRRYDKRQLNHRATKRLEGHLIHWTRTCNHPWPGETRTDFYRALTEARENYPRSASATLKRILREKRLRASERHMPNSIAMVSLTSSSLVESVALMKYRARYREMTIEPYAIAMPLETARRIDAYQVSYRSTAELAQLSHEEKLFAHSRGSNVVSWEREKEWRIRGDVDLTSVWGELVVLTENQDQALRLEREFGIESLSVFE